MAQVNAPQVQNEQAQAQQQQFTEICQAIAANPKETLQQLEQSGINQEQVIEMVQSQAKAGNPAAVEAMNALQQQAQMARKGAKLEYIKRLYGQCPEGYEMKMFKAGGQICKKCEKIAQQAVESENPVIAKFLAFRKGGKAKKCQEGSDVTMEKCGGKAKKKC